MHFLVHNEDSLSLSSSLPPPIIIARLRSEGIRCHVVHSQAYITHAQYANDQSRTLDTTHIDLELQYGVYRRHLHVKCFLGDLQFQTVHGDQSAHCNPGDVNARL